MDFITIKELEHKTFLITINKESSLNALNQQVLKELGEALESEKVQTARTVFLTGAGEKAFVAGADISEMKDLNSVQASEFSQLGHEVFRKLEKLKAVTLSLVDGFALGGGFELALSTDVILATEKSKFGLPEVGLGLIPGFGGTQRLSRSLGLHYAKALSLSGDMASANDLLQRGLVYKVLNTKEDLFEEAKAYAKRVASKGPHAVSVAKQCIQTGYSLNTKEALAHEQQEFALLFGTKETQEGVQAFMEKRKPNFN